VIKESQEGLRKYQSKRSRQKRERKRGRATASKVYLDPALAARGRSGSAGSSIFQRPAVADWRFANLSVPLQLKKMQWLHKIISPPSLNKWKETRTIVQKKYFVQQFGESTFLPPRTALY
jgi:hypothetical protein